VTAWYHSVPLPQDRLGKFCPGRRVFIQFETTPGDLPLLGVEADNLTGDGLEVSIREVGTRVICHHITALYLINYFPWKLPHFKHFFGLAKQNVVHEVSPRHSCHHISTQQVTGGLFLRPIPGHMLQTVETTPQVTISVAMICHVRNS